jgi:hypothetical protein
LKKLSFTWSWNAPTARTLPWDDQTGVLAVLEIEPRRAEGAHRGGDLPGDRLGRAHVQRARGDLAVELGPAGREPAALGADPVTHDLVVGPELLASLGVGVGEVARRVDADRQRGRLAELGEGAR